MRAVQGRQGKRRGAYTDIREHRETQTDSVMRSISSDLIIKLSDASSTRKARKEARSVYGYT